ncbi:hypothetical protein [Qipengyuania atrilutea]|uniref:hypothetical protein n=1 Tax=Qipengyuania atrilutea TaxID=2744473 RepID=UPI001C3CB77B|nr:hypothetical protein [Actirhodobacter atriluteus]
MTFRNLVLTALAAFCLPSTLASQPLPGVDEEETVIRTGVEEFVFGNGDVVFVRDGTLRWYRIETNEGCIGGEYLGRQIAFDTTGPAGRIDKLTNVIFPRYHRICGIVSIRRSETPPQFDSDSRVTLD